MGCIPFANFHFQMGVTVMGFAEDSGHILVPAVKKDFRLTYDVDQGKKFTEKISVCPPIVMLQVVCEVV